MSSDHGGHEPNPLDESASAEAENHGTQCRAGQDCGDGLDRSPINPLQEQRDIGSWRQGGGERVNAEERDDQTESDPRW